jgi:ubiquinone/menaquinone biosynthesis C-methylase UbiE
MAAQSSTSQPNPEILFTMFNAYQQTMALKGAIELEVFTHINDGATTAPEIAKRCNASEKGVRVLCDFLTVNGLLSKTNGAYGLTPTSGAFLSKRSPAYMGTAARFLTHESLMSNFKDVAGIVRKGGTIQDQGFMGPEADIWVDFARAMGPMVGMSSQMVAPMVATPGKPMKVLDIAAGHGLFGIAVAKHNPAAQVVGVDWKNVLQVAVENANKMGVGDRYQTIPGSAFEVDFGNGYDVVLLPNFLHHFDMATDVTLLKKVRAALKPGGLVATLEFVPNEDRVSPPVPASFSMMMLGGTAGGDAYTFRELDQIFRQAGFGESEMHEMAPLPQRLIVTQY